MPQCLPHAFGFPRFDGRYSGRLLFRCDIGQCVEFEVTIGDCKNLLEFSQG